MTYTSPLPVTDGQFYRGSSLELRDVSMAYGDIEVIREVSIDVEPGTTTCIIGPSGSGKSTLLRGVNRLHEPTSGEVLLAGESALKMKPERLRTRVGLVFQHFNLFPDHTALENVALALRNVKGMSKSESLRVAAARLDDVGLGERSDHRPRDLSGGQQQRVAIARALATRPELLFADEPTGNLDSRTGRSVLALLAAASTEYGQSIAMVTHDPIAASYADRIVFLADGKVVDDRPRSTPEQISALMLGMERAA